MEIKVLVVEDEEAIREMLELALCQSGFAVELAADVGEAEILLDKSVPDIILLDWMLPGVSGIDWARRLKKDELYAEIPIILLTARGAEEDKVKGLDSGADDYVTKPFSPKELSARIRAVLRRAGSLAGQSTMEMAGLRLDSEQHRFSIEGTTVELSPTEYRLMEFFMSHPQRVYSRNQLLDQVWGRSTFIEDRTVDVHIRRLRKILIRHGRDELIQTVRGFGYRFSEKP
ncbi:MAG: phosphate regulon transcriptional regulatory protein PhoB [Gammaproteobacteria bacterium]|nr:MAG: phosphate regulon transcriptional regulatory protein PhoB [Gammaproteobacteria bacterium]